MDTVDPLRFVFAFLFVIGLIGLSAFALKRYSRTAGGALLLGQVVNQSPTSTRLQVVEVRRIDQRRRLMLVRRDNVEHLLLLADNRELVVESNIIPSTDTPHA